MATIDQTWSGARLCHLSWDHTVSKTPGREPPCPIFFFAEDEPTPSAGMPKTADYLCAFRGTFDREPHGICWVRVFEEAGQTPVMVMGELPQNTSTSVTNMAEYLAPELIQRHFPQRFEEPPPAIFLKHSVEEVSVQK
jgi:hypothetical protein